MAMNGLQRCLKVLNWELPDRIPVIPQNSDMAIDSSFKIINAFTVAEDSSNFFC